MNYKKFINILYTKLTLICTITLITMIISSCFTFFIIKPKYESKISLIIGNTNGATSQNYDKFILNKNLVETYGTFSKTNIVAENVIDSLNLNMSNNELLSMINYDIDPLTQLLTLSVKSTDQTQAATICNQLAKSLKKVTAIINKSDNVSIVDYASIPKSPYNIKIIINLLGSFILGIVISIFLIFVHEILDNTIRSHNDLEELLSAPLIATIPISK